MQHTEWFYYEFVNLMAGLGMLSIAFAFAALISNRAEHRKRQLPWVLFALISAASISRIFRGLQLDSNFVLASDGIASICAMLGGILIWANFRTVLNRPSLETLQQENIKLKEERNELLQAKLLFEAFMDNNPAVSFVEDQEMKLIYVNRAYENNVGVSASEVVGQNSVLWSTTAQANEMVEQNRQTLTSREAIRRVVQFPKFAGGPTEPWVVVRFPIQTGSRSLVGAVAFNISAEYEKDRINSELACIVESSHDAIVGNDLNGNITSWNRGAEELYGFTAEEMIGKSMSILIPGERRNELPNGLDKISRGVRIEDYETLRVCKRGIAKNVSESISPILHGNTIIGAAVIARDITLLKKQQKEIEELNEQLKSRVYELAEANAALQTARDQALEASNLKSAFCANISHEIRTPLSGIMGLNEVLIHNGNLNEEDLSLARIVQQSAQALLNVVNDILDLSKIEAGKITLEYAPFNPRALLQDCTNLMAPSAHQKGIEYELYIDPDVPEKIYGDVSRVRQVLLNLIGNAIKFTESGKVRIRTNVLEIEPKEVCLKFVVEDTGVGIAPDQQRLLFMPFGQLDQGRTRKFGGTGLGLAISKRFVEMMNGDIHVSSAEDAGTTFTVVLSFDRLELHGAQEFGTERIMKPGIEPIPPGIAKGKRVLVVEDNLILQQLVLRQLHSLGIEAQGIVFGEEAIPMATSGNFDVVLMDINLPDMNGIEVTAAIRSFERTSATPPVPIIALTAGAMKGDKERALTAGMNDYLAKPVAIGLLKNCIEKWIGGVPTRRSA